MNQLSHKPVLLESVLDILRPQMGESYLDLTAGLGGHAKEVLAKTKTPKQAVLVDRDGMAIDYLKTHLPFETNLIHQDYLSASQDLLSSNRKFDMILLDLGVSSPQLDQAERGFSFNKEAALDMRMNQSDRLTAERVVNNYTARELASLIQTFGEESANKSRLIAQNIVAHRPIQTTTQLAKLIEDQFGRHGRAHPATKVFQAIRVEVNQEFVQLEEVLPLLPRLLNSGGRLAIITFHSLEDRRVKQFLQNEFRKGLAGQLRPIRKPISGKIEQAYNPRSRSAILRGAYKK